MKINFLALALLFASFAWATSPQRLNLTNQYGEQSQNYVNGTYLPLPPTTNFNQVVIFSGTTITPSATTGLNVAGSGSLYISRNPASYGSPKLWLNFGTITAPAWGKVGP